MEPFLGSCWFQGMKAGALFGASRWGLGRTGRPSFDQMQSSTPLWALRMQEDPP